MSEELIRRSDAIDIIEITPFEDYGDYIKAREIIENLPTIDVVPKDFHDKTCEAMAKRHTEEVQKYMWTPCSERLPEKYDYYLVTAKNHKNDDTYLVISWFQGYWFTDAIAIAWMPLPELYKGGASDEQVHKSRLSQSNNEK